MSMGFDVDDPRDEHYRWAFPAKIYSAPEGAAPKPRLSPEPRRTYREMKKS